MAVYGNDGKIIEKEPVAAGGALRKSMDQLLAEIGKIDDVNLSEQSQALPVELNTKHQYLTSKITDKPDNTLPKNLKMVKKPDNRVKAGFKLVHNFKVTKLKMPKMATVGAASVAQYQPGSTSALRHDVETQIIPLDVLRIRMMTDPYNFTIRQMMSDIVFQDPTIAPAIQKRNKAFFSNDFYLDFELKSMLNPTTGQPYTPDETQAVLATQRQQYLAYLLQLDTWRKLPTIDILDKMKRSHVSVISQGRALNLIVPKPDDLMDGELPISVRNITWENTGQVYVDTVYWQVVGVRLFFINKDMAMPDEMVYVLGKNYGLRWLQDYFGAAELEPFLQMSRINRIIMNYHSAKSVENAYMSKIVISADVQGDQATRQAQLSNLIASLTAQGTDILGIEMRAKMEAVPVSADAELMQMWIDVLDDRLIAGCGSTRAQMGRTENLNRDTATIMEVENIRNVRTPDEELVGNAFATQMFDPLLAHLVGQDVEQIPVRIVIKRIEPTDEAIDPDLENKLAQLKGASQGMGGEKGGLVQQDAGGEGMAGTKSFGSAGSIISQREKMLMSLIKDKDGVPIRSQVCKILLKEFGSIKSTLGASAENADSGENDDDANGEYEEATIDDVKAWASIPNYAMMLHYINPNRWTDRDDYEFIAENAKNFDSLTPDQQLVIIRSFYFRNPGQPPTKVLNDYGFETPEDDSEYCWTVLLPTHKQHLIDPEQKYDWSPVFVQKPYPELNDNEKAIADGLYKWRHTEHTAEGLKGLEPIPDYVEEDKKKSLGSKAFPTMGSYNENHDEEGKFASSDSSGSGKSDDDKSTSTPKDSTTFALKTNQREQDKMEQNLFPENKRGDLGPAPGHPKFINDEANEIVHTQLLGDWSPPHKDEFGRDDRNFSVGLPERAKFASNVNIPSEFLDKGNIPKVADKPDLSYEEFKKYQSTEYPDQWKEHDEAWHIQNYAEGNQIDSSVASKMQDYDTKYRWIDGRDSVTGSEVKQYFKDNPNATLVNIDGQWMVKGTKLSDDERKAIYLHQMDDGVGYMKSLDKNQLDEMVTRYDRIAPYNKDNAAFQKINDLDSTKAKEWNDKFQSEWENQKSFFRGSKGTDELDSYLKTDKVGGAGSGYHYMATTSSFEVANKFEGGVVIEYDGDSVRDVGHRVTYSVKPTSQGVSASVNNMETMTRPMAFKYANELETRIPEGTNVSDLRIKRIYVDPTKLGIKTPEDASNFEKKYGSLSKNFVYMKMDSYNWREGALNSPSKYSKFKPEDFGRDT